jgi:hypothetical protein
VHGDVNGNRGSAGTRISSPKNLSHFRHEQPIGHPLLKSAGSPPRNSDCAILGLGSDDSFHRAPRVHHAARQRSGRVAARGAGAAASDAGGGNK